MALTEEQVRHVAQLARLALSDDEVKRLGGQLSAILEAMEQLRALDTEGVAPTSHALLAEAPWRPDVELSTLEVEKALANAPSRAGTAFSVPKIIE